MSNSINIKWKRTEYFIESKLLGDRLRAAFLSEVPRGCLADPAWVTVRVLVSRPTPAGTLFENPHNTRPFSEFGTARLYPDAPAGRG